jgi:hypothetical protein
MPGLRGSLGGYAVYHGGHILTMKTLRRFSSAYRKREIILSLGTSDPDVADIVRGNIKYLSLAVVIRQALRAAGLQIKQFELISMFDAALNDRRAGVGTSKPEFLAALSGVEEKETWMLQELSKAMNQVYIEIDISWFNDRLLACKVVGS